jgi:hypothetical protein
MVSDRGRVCVFVIDGKDQNDQQSDDGTVMARTAMEKISTISSAAIMAMQDQL